MTLFAIIITEEGYHVRMHNDDDEIYIHCPVTGRVIYYDSNQTTLRDVLEMDVCGHPNYDIRGCIEGNNDIRSLQEKTLDDLYNEYAENHIVIVIS